MFRLGGSTSGITSGLDTKRGRFDGPGGYAGIDYDKAYETSKELQINITHEKELTSIGS